VDVNKFQCAIPKMLVVYRSKHTGRAYLLSDQQVGCASINLNFLAIKTKPPFSVQSQHFLDDLIAC
jgi:hypothetical protein